MNCKRKPPSILVAVCATGVALLNLVSCFCMVKSVGAPNVLVITFILLSLGLNALAVLQWVLYFRAYVDFQIDQLRQEQQSLVLQPPPAPAPAKD